MEANEKLEMLLEYSGMKILPFSKEVGQGSQTFYDIRSGKIQSFTFDEPYTPEPKPDKKSDVLKQLENIKSQNGKTTEIYTIFKEKRELEELKKISFK